MLGNGYIGCTAVAYLSVAVSTPGIQASVAPHVYAVNEASANRDPVVRRADLHGRKPVYIGAVTDLCISVITPAVQSTAASYRHRVCITRRDSGPVRCTPYLHRAQT